MKFFLLLWSLVLAFVASDDLPCGKYTCPEGNTLRNADCTGFQIRNSDNWDDFAIYIEETDTCVMAEDAPEPYDFNSNFLCCSVDESDCCEDYPAGFYAGFGIGVGGIAFMILYACYLCFGTKSEPKLEA